MSKSILQNDRTPDGDPVILELERMNSTCRYSGRSAPRVKVDGEFVPKEGTHDKTLCEIIDLTTGKTYAVGEGQSEPEALANALVIARTAPKPLTPAQAADPNFANALKERDELKERLAAMQAQLDALTTAKPKMPAAKNSN